MSFVKWRDIPGYTGYQASSDGRIRSIDRTIEDNNQYSNYTTKLKGRELKQQVWRRERRTVSLSINGKVKRLLVYRLVALAFHPNPDNLPIVLHLDNNPLNNAASNLKWGTYSENTQAAVDDGLMPRGEAASWSKLRESDVLEIRNQRNKGEKLRVLASKFGLSEAGIYRICSKRTWAHV